MSVRVLKPEALSAEAFAPYGQVLDVATAATISINEGLTTRFNDLAQISLGQGHCLVNVFRSKPLALPHSVKIMERHPLGSQCFFPLQPCRWLVLVAPAAEVVNAEALKLFIVDRPIGINLNPNTWHHYQMLLDQEGDFLVVDRGGEGVNLQELAIEGEAIIEAGI